MARQDPLIVSFNGGELSPWLRGRVDLPKFATGCEQLFNQIARVQGPAARRPGTVKVGRAKINSGAVGLIPFEANTGSNFVLEVGANYMRFWDAQSRLVIQNSGGFWGINLGSPAPAELVTPWITTYSPDGTMRIQNAQSNDIMWLTQPQAFPQKLSRIAQYKFQMANMGDSFNIPVPFNDIDPRNTIAITASSMTGAGTLTATAPYFTPTMVDEYIYLEQPFTDNIVPWETGKAVVFNDFRSSAGRNYQALNSGTTGTVKPTHSVGNKSDGVVSWVAWDDGYGVGLITGFISTTKVNVNAAIQFPNTVVTTGTTRWARQAWNENDGYPNAVAIFRERLCFARGQTIWLSVVGDYENFTRTLAGQVTNDLAITLTIASDKNDRILWLSGLDQLIAGTANGEWIIGESTANLPLGPMNVRAAKVGAYGSSPAAPVKVGEGLLYLQRGGTRLREFIYDAGVGNYRSIDLNEYAEHIPSATGFTQVVSTRLPDPITWAVCNTVVAGDLAPHSSFAGLTYERVQQVGAWHRHALGGTGPGEQPAQFGPKPGGAAIMSMAVVTSPDGVNDDVWMVTKRFTTPTNCIEVMGPSDALAAGQYQVYTQWTDPRAVALVDFAAASSVPPGGDRIPVTWIPIGETAEALADGAVSSPAIIDSLGLPTLASTEPGARRAWVGYGYQSILKPVALVGASQTGSPHGKLARVEGLVVRIFNSSSFLHGYDENSILYREEMRGQGDTMDDPVSLKTGDFLVRPESGSERQPRVYLAQDQPLPLTILALFPRLRVED